MTTHISELIKRLKDEGYQLTTAAALLNKKATASDGSTGSSAKENID